MREATVNDALKEGDRARALAWAVSAVERERKAWLSKHDQWSSLNDIARRHAAAAQEALEVAEKAFREVEAHRASVGAAVADTSIGLTVTSMSAGDAGWRRALTILGDGHRRPDVTVFGEPGEEILT